MFDFRPKAAKAVSTKTLAIILALSLFAPEMFARFNPKPASPNFFSLNQEVQVGQQEAAKVDKQMPLVTDPVLNRYITNLGARLVAVAPGPKYPYTFKIVNQKDINAFALPGGPIHVNLGTIQAADNEAQLAGVMAHEMGHVIMRHSTHMASQQMMYTAPLSILGGLLGRGTVGQLAQLGVSFGLGSVFMKYSRDAENQADLVGTGIMHDAGYNPHAMVDFFHKLEESGGSRGSQFFSDHPNPGNRAQSVETELRTLSPMTYRQDSAEFRDIKARVGGMRAYTAQEIHDMQQRGTNPNNGNNNGGQQGGGQQGGQYPADNGNYQTLNHSAYTISYPSNWQVYGDANSEVTISPSNGLVGDAVAYGVIISGFQMEDRGGSDPFDEALHQLLSQLRQSNPDLRQASREDNFTLNGVRAKSLMLLGVSPMQDNRQRSVRERDWLVALDRGDGTILYLVFISPDQNFSQSRPTFESMLRSIRLR